MAEKKYIVDEETGKRFRIGGCLISDKPSDLPKFGATRVLSNKHLPPSVDLRQLMTPVENQGQLNSCVGNALAGAYEFLIMKNTKKHIDVSRLFIYYVSRCKDGYAEYAMADQGTFIRSAIAALAESGCCKEEFYPYNPSSVNSKPPAHCYSEAKNYRIAQALNVQLDLNEMRGCLAEGYPFAFGLQTFQSFAAAGNNGGRVPMPQVAYESQAAQHGWHAMLAVGYSDPSQCFIVRNSWGEDWGDKGYCYIPYAYVCDPAHCQDLHAIKIVANDRPTPDNSKVVNPYNWNIDNDKKFVIPPNHKDHSIGFDFFWKLNDTFNYFNSIWKNGKKEDFSWGKSQLVTNTSWQHMSAPNKHESAKSFVLWIDRKAQDHTHVEKQLSTNAQIKLEFVETMARAEKHLLAHIDKIKSASSPFQIVCRGYYKDESKNPLNLLQFLDNHRLHHIPVVVFTQDASGLNTHLQNQAPSMGLYDWKKRLFVTDSSAKLVANIKENIDNRK